MSEPTCVCGHSENEHGALSRQCYGAETCCPCDEFRPAVPWPTEEGWWWMQSEEFESVAYARMMDGKIVASIALYETYKDECGFEEFTAKHGTARFVKCESNPFMEHSHEQ